MIVNENGRNILDIESEDDHVDMEEAGGADKGDAGSTNDPLKNLRVEPNANAASVNEMLLVMQQQAAQAAQQNFMMMSLMKDVVSGKRSTATKDCDESDDDSEDLGALVVEDKRVKKS